MTTNTKFWTWDQISAKMMSELDILPGDDAFDDDELREYANDGIDEAEALIHTLNADYFLTKHPTDDGTDFEDAVDEYALPADIYAMKIRKVIFYEGSEVYEIKRCRTLDQFLNYRAARQESTNTDNRNLTYFIVNATSGDPRIKFSPVPTATGAFEIWYLRQANRLEDNEDICDIHEFVSFVFDFISERVWFKRAAGSARHQTAALKLEGTRQRMVDTLQEMVVDADNEVEPDASFYREFG